ncbi:hypothetical protein MB02_11510 [Croceicoccus estronivorus]|uniref:hypothetical protein n=1 Tax=Croceicoccus estronivorus TaxID=1172626 RepID=UPI00082C49D2|nr:hypothetical protein [Croceicoccus estronivorus]OCC23267.1 hypothetical protein MB02_11510 [Croceicoccus estronivorus]
MALLPVADTHVLARKAGWAVLIVQALYVLVLLMGLSQLPDLDSPIADPWFAGMEVLIVLLAPAVILFFAAVPGLVLRQNRAWAWLACAAASLCLMLSAGLHLVLLTLGRTEGAGVWSAQGAFVWPSLPYLVDIIAWDSVFPLAPAALALALRGMRLPPVVALLLWLSAGLSLAGLLGPITGQMPLRNLGIVGYALCFPMAVYALLRSTTLRA